MDHPMVTEIMRTGYPGGMQEREVHRTDALGNEVYKEDEIFVYNDEIFLKESLTDESIQILEIMGATLKIA